MTKGKIHNYYGVDKWHTNVPTKTTGSLGGGQGQSTGTSTSIRLNTVLKETIGVK